MISRREILVAGSGSLAAVGLGAAAKRAEAASQILRASPPALILGDTSLAGFAAVSRAARENEISIVPFEGDLGTVWLDHLEPLWRLAPQPIVGATFGGAFFCAERLAHDRGLVPAFALSAPLSEPELSNAVHLAIAAVARPARAGKRSDAIRPDRPVVWALVPRAPRPGDER